MDVQLSLLTVDIHGSNFAMHFSTISPPRPSLLMLVTKGPALLAQPDKTKIEIIADMRSCVFFIGYS